MNHRITMKYNSGMEQVRSKEQQAELIAHLLDDAIRLPGTSIRFGADPIVGLIPVVGDVIAVLSGALIILIARQLRVPTNDLIRMAYHQLLNGLIGAIPVLGDLYSFGFKPREKLGLTGTDAQAGPRRIMSDRCAPTQPLGYRSGIY